MVEKWMRAGEDEQVSRTFSGRGRTLRAMTSLTSPLLRVISAAASKLPVNTSIACCDYSWYIGVCIALRNHFNPFRKHAHQNKHESHSALHRPYHTHKSAVQNTSIECGQSAAVCP